MMIRLPPIDINDEPQFANVHTALKYLGVEENTATGTSVFKIYSTDLDPGDTTQYTWNSNPSTGTSYFSLDASSMFLVQNINDIMWICRYYIQDTKIQLIYIWCNINASDGNKEQNIYLSVKVTIKITRSLFFFMSFPKVLLV